MQLAADVAPIVRDAAERSHPRETGGLLIGWWDEDRIVVRTAVEVPDPGATRYSWSRSPDSAQAALDRELAADPHPSSGYVGDWHTHPADQGPSRQDLRTIAKVSTQVGRPVLLLVHRSTGAIEQTIAHHGRPRRLPALPPNGAPQ